MILLMYIKFGHKSNVNLCYIKKMINFMAGINKISGHC